jgi:hypothetical protein
MVKLKRSVFYITLLVIVLGLFCNKAAAQERTQKAFVPLLHKSDKIDSVTMWINASGHWSSQRAEITKMWMATVEYNAKKYYVLAYDAEKPDWDYPALQMDSHASVTYESFIMTQDEYAKLYYALNTLDSKLVKVTATEEVIYVVDLITAGFDTTISRHVVEIATGQSTGYEKCFAFSCQALNSGSVVRFSTLRYCDDIKDNVLTDNYEEIGLEQFKKLLPKGDTPPPPPPPAPEPTKGKKKK